MNTEAVASELKSLILDNRLELAEGLLFQGEPKELSQVTKSILTPVLDTLFVLVNIPRAFEQSRNGRITNLRHPSREVVYTVQIEVADSGDMQLTDEQPYETVHQNFRTVLDRIANLIEAQVWVTASPKTQIERVEGTDRRIDIVDLSAPQQDGAGNMWARLYGQVLFTLISECE